jgi:hypothetical protein
MYQTPQPRTCCEDATKTKRIIIIIIVGVYVREQVEQGQWSRMEKITDNLIPNWRPIASLDQIPG